MKRVKAERQEEEKDSQMKRVKAAYQEDEEYRGDMAEQSVILAPTPAV